MVDAAGADHRGEAPVGDRQVEVARHARRRRTYPRGVTPAEVHRIVDSIVHERTVDIVTVGRHSGRTRVTEIWTTVVAGELYVCGTPGGAPGSLDHEPRDWLANLVAEPTFTLRLKQSVPAELPARAVPVTDRATRERVFAAPASAYYREHARSMDELVERGPMVHVELVGAARAATDALRAAGLDTSP